MPRDVRVLTTSFARSPTSTLEENRQLACDYVAAATAERADLVCLPENFLLTNVNRSPRDQAEPLDGPTFQALSPLAKQQRVWIVGTWLTLSDDGELRNTAMVIDRDGNLAGTYHKAHPGLLETAAGIVAGPGPVVIETDFGRLGLAICFDIGWPQHWADLAAMNAEIVVWPSAYDGGFPLQSYAWQHRYHIVTSVRTAHSRVIDITGEILQSTSEWDRLAAVTIDLDKRLFHIDEQFQKLQALHTELGERIAIHARSEENLFTLSSRDPELSLDAVIDQYGLEEFQAYHDRSEAAANRLAGQ